MKVRLGAFDYDIIFGPNDGSDHGSTDTTKKRIFINIEDSKQIQSETLLHELLHVASEDCSLFKHPI